MGHLNVRDPERVYERLGRAGPHAFESYTVADGLLRSTCHEWKSYMQPSLITSARK